MSCSQPKTWAKCQVLTQVLGHVLCCVLPQPLHIFEDSTAKSGIFAYFLASVSDAATRELKFFFCENADFSGGESEMASLSSPESRIKAAAQPGIKNQARCAGRNQESRISRGGQNPTLYALTAKAQGCNGQRRQAMRLERSK